MFAGRPRLGRELLLLGVVVPLLLQQVQVQARATCKLHLEGFGSAQGIKSAQLSCSGGTITAHAHPVLWGNLTRTFSGVQWSDAWDYVTNYTDCLLILCGDTSATFSAPVIRNLNVSKTTGVFLCLTGNSDVLFEGSQFQENAGCPITTLSRSVKLHVKGSNFTGNNVTWNKVAGGALWLGGGTAVVESSVFSSNVVMTDGGAIFVANNLSSIDISSVVFKDNSAAEVGGAVHIQGNGTRVSMQSCVFSNNTAQWGAGLSLDGSPTVAMSLTNFTTNHADGAGGAIYAKATAKLNFTRSLVAGNTAKLHGGGVGVWQTATAHLDLVEVKDNTAEKWGGGLSVGGTAKVVVLNVMFQNNTSYGCCGAVYGYENSTTKIMHSQLVLNSAFGSLGGGGIGVWENATMVVFDADITNNTAEFAGGIDVEEHGSLYLESSVLIGNTARVFGAGMYVGANSTAVVKACTLAHNVAAEKDGGAMYSVDNSKVAIADSVFKSNRARYGGAMYCANNSVQIIRSHFLDNIASTSGGGVAVEANVTCTMDACTMGGNRADLGGAMWMVDANHVALRNCLFGNNVATSFSGGVHVGGDTHNLTMSACRFINNTAKQEGGALCVSGSSKVFLLKDTQGVGNSAGSGGFASLDKSARMEVIGGSFDRNFVTSNGRGGFMLMSDRSVVVLQACHIQGNVQQADVYGGAFNLEGNATLELLSCAMSRLHAQRGGAIAAFHNSSFHVRNSTFFNCTAVLDGGGLFSSSYVNQSLLGVAFRLMRAKEGGIMCIMRGSVLIANTTFVNGTATEGGGGLNVDLKARVVLNHCSIQGCSSTDSGGGGLLVKGDARVVLIDSNISDCHTQWGGGAIAAHENAIMLLQRCTMQRNKGRVCGGAIHIESSARLGALNCNIVDNVCDSKGGAMCAVAGSTIIFQGCVLSRNVADKGAGIWLDGTATMGLQSTKVQNNTARSLGGGVFLASSQCKFSQTELKASVGNNKAPLINQDVMVAPTTISNTNNNTIEGFVSRLGTDAGLLNVTLRTTGVQGLPAEYIPVHAVLDGLVVAKSNTGADGLVNMQVKLRKPPGTYQVKFTVPGADDPPATSITIHVVQCGLGDVTSVTRDACQTCETGYYSLDPRNHTCDICVPNAECRGGATITSAPDFWHSSPHSIQMHRCLNPEACPGGDATFVVRSGDQNMDFKSSQCATGYMGNLCGQCDVQSGYGTVKPFTCKPCMKPAVTIVLYSVAALVMLVAVRVMSALAMADSGASAPDQPRPCDLIKPLVLYAQYLFIITNINGVPWPKPVSVVVQALSFFWSSTASNSLGLDCVLRSTAAMPVAMQKTLFSLLMPLAMLVVLLLLDILWSLCLRRRRRGARLRGQLFNTKDRFLSLCVCMAFLFLPSWLHVAFSLFTCIALDVYASFPYEAAAVGSYLAADMSEQCYKLGGYHRAWALGLGVPLLVMFCLVVPVGLYVFLWLSRKRGKLGDDNFRKHFGFLYRTWREDVCWWEAVTCCQTICIVAIGTFGHVLGVYFQSLVSLAALGTIFVLMLLVRPHKCQVAFVVTLFSVWVLITTAFSALTFLSYQKVTPAYGYTMAMGVFVLVINITFVLSTLWRLVRLVQWGIVRRWCGCYSATPPCCGPCEPCRQLHRRAGSWLDDVGMSRMGAAAVAMAGGCCACMPTVLVPTPPLESAKGRDRSRGKDPDVPERGQQQEQQQEPKPAAAENEC